MSAPTSDQVATAILAAAREVAPAADVAKTAMAVLAGEFSQKGGPDFSVSRTRVYAAFALDDLFEIGSTAVSRLVGIKKPGSASAFLATNRCNLASNGMRWFDPAALDRVKAAVAGAAPKPEHDGAARATRDLLPAALASEAERAARPPAPRPAPQRAERIREEARRIESAIDDERPRFDGLGRREYVPAPVDNKRALREDFARAAANTAAQQRARHSGEA